MIANIFVLVSNVHKFKIGNKKPSNYKQDYLYYLNFDIHKPIKNIILHLGGGWKENLLIKFLRTCKIPSELPTNNLDHCCVPVELKIIVELSTFFDSKPVELILL